jgi:hypothetical protein
MRFMMKKILSMALLSLLTFSSVSSASNVLRESINDTGITLGGKAAPVEPEAVVIKSVYSNYEAGVHSVLHPPESLSDGDLHSTVSTDEGPRFVIVFDKSYEISKLTVSGLGRKWAKLTFRDYNTDIALGNAGCGSPSYACEAVLEFEPIVTDKILLTTANWVYLGELVFE